MENNNQNNEASWISRIQALDSMPGETLNAEATWKMTRKKMKRGSSHKKTKWYWIAAGITSLISLVFLYSNHNKTAATANSDLSTIVPVRGTRTGTPTDSIAPVRASRTGTPEVLIPSVPGALVRASRTGIPKELITPVPDHISQVPALQSTTPNDTTSIAQITPQTKPQSRINKPLPIISINDLYHHDDNADEIAMKNYHLRNLFRPDEANQSKAVAIDHSKNKFINRKDSSQN